jgi:hypothetical protein
MGTASVKLDNLPSCASVSHGPYAKIAAILITRFLLAFWDYSQMISVGIFAAPKLVSHTFMNSFLAQMANLIH